MIKRFIYLSILFISMLSATTVDTDKEIYGTVDEITVSFTGLMAQDNEWLAIYPEGSTNDYGNIVAWKLTGAVAEGDVVFDSLAIGIYEVRIFEGANFLVVKQIEVQDNVVAVATVETTQDTYSVDEPIVATFDNMAGNQNDWIGIYPLGSSNDWANMLQWKWIRGDIFGLTNFEPLAAGDYEVRVFFNNSFNTEAGYIFSVEENAAVTTVATNKEIYAVDEPIVATFDNMAGNQNDWIGIYPAASNNDWANMLQWKWIRGDVAGVTNFEPLVAGAYEVRVFFNNSFSTEASYAFSVEAAEVLEDLVLSKNVYDPFELIHVEYNNMRGVQSDWIGIFLVGADNQQESAIQWRDARSLVSGELSFNGLAAGAYEIRSYFDDVHKKTLSFTVQNKAVVRVLYDDFEDGVIGPRWVRYAGPEMTLLNVGATDLAVGHTDRQAVVNGEHSLRTYKDYRGGLNYSGYTFNFENPDSTLKFLELDMKIGVSSHVFAFGVNLRTKFGNRRIEFASWLNHTLPNGNQVIRGPYRNVLEGHREAFTQDNYLHVHPGPTDFYVATSSLGAGTNMFVHYKINIEEKLRVLEPDNELLGITYFTTSGGDYDNLALVSH